MVLLPIGQTERELRTELGVATQVMVRRVGGGPVEGVSVRFAIRTDGNPIAEGRGVDAQGVDEVIVTTGPSGVARQRADRFG